jgi:hypothetical protein
MSDDESHKWNARLKSERLGVVEPIERSYQRTYRGRIRVAHKRMTKHLIEARQIDARRRETYAADMAAYLARPEACEIVKGPTRGQTAAPEGHSDRCLCSSCIRARGSKQL